MKYMDQVIIDNNYKKNIAIIEGEQKYTYEKLNILVNKAAVILSDFGVGHQDKVMIILEKSLHFIVYQFAIMRLGAIAIPIDCTLPLNNVNRIIEICNPEFILCKNENFYKGGKLIHERNMADVFVLKETNHKKMCNIVDHVRRSETDIAYIIFTSGSTGEPKGVMIEHKSIMHFIQRMNEYMNYNEKMVMLSLAPLYFDTSIHEIYCTLAAGGTVYLLEKLKHISLIGKIIHNYKITDLVIVSTIFNMINNYLDEDNKDKFDSLINIIYCGESCDRNIVIRMKELLSHVNIIQGYGPTETTVGCIFKKIENDETYGYGVFPLGKPLKGTKILLMNEKGKIVNKNEIGEAHILGNQLMRGYCNNESLTSRVLVNMHQICEERMYKSGDYMLQLSNGEYVFCGRKDDIVKINGKQVCLSEVEAEVNKIQQISKGYILSYVDYNQINRIGLLFISKEDITTEEIVKRLKLVLPEYMIPYKIFRIDEKDLHCTLSGKLDKKALLELFKIRVKKNLEERINETL